MSLLLCCVYTAVASTVAAGYGVWEVDSTAMSYRYKLVGYPIDYQMRVYDLNTVRIDGSLVSGSSSRNNLAAFACGYDTVSRNNELLVNVFSYGPGWNITAYVLECPLEVTQVEAYDPLHILCYEIPMLNHGKKPASVTRPGIHFFRIKASAPDTPVVVTVTDPWGHTFTETVERPMPFTVSME